MIFRNTREMSMDPRRTNDLLKAIETASMKFNNDSMFMDVAGFHAFNLAAKPAKGKFRSDEEMASAVFSALFLESLNAWESKITITPPKNAINCAIPIVHSDVFNKDKSTSLLDFNKALFYKTLKLYDILHLIIKEVLSDSYKLQLIHKVGSMQILEKLNIFVELPIEKGSPSFVGDYVRAIVLKYTPENPESLELSVKPKASMNIKLGRLSEMEWKEIPDYIRGAFKPTSSSYMSYLSSFPAFNNIALFDQLAEDMGFDVRRSYSLHEEWNRKRCPAHLSGQKLYEIRRKRDYEDTMFEAKECFDSGDFPKGFDCCHLAKKIMPKDPRIYELSGNQYEQLALVEKAMEEWAIALALDNSYCKKKIAKYMAYMSKKLLLRRNYQTAYRCAQSAEALDSSNILAKQNLQYLQKKHPNIMLLCDDLSALEEKRKILEQHLTEKSNQ